MIVAFGSHGASNGTLAELAGLGFSEGFTESNPLGHQYCPPVYQENERPRSIGSTMPEM